MPTKSSYQPCCNTDFKIASPKNGVTLLWKAVFILHVLLFSSNTSFAQVKEQFAQQLTQDSVKRDFEQRLVVVDRLLARGLSALNVDSLKQDPGFAFLEKKTLKGRLTLIFDLTWSHKDVYDQLEKEGKINRLKSLRLKGQLKIIARGIANEVELPKKTNPRQSYNDFYLEVIERLLREHQEVVQADKLDFATYQSWEKEARLSNAIAIRQYRETFIRFLYKHYKL